MAADSTTKDGRDVAAMIEARMDDWRRRLIDLSFRNRLINYRPTKSSTLELTSPTIHELLVDPERTKPFDFFFPPEPEESDSAATVDDRDDRPAATDLVTTIEDPERLKKVLANLARRSNAEFDDKAIRILHLAIGFLNWTDPVRKEEVRSPLILVPVELHRESARDPYQLFIATDSEIVINPALTVKLEKDAGLALPDDWAWDDQPIEQELDEIRRAVDSTDWTVDEKAVLGMFSFQKLVMHRDLLRNEARIAEHPMIQALAESRPAAEIYDSFNSVPAESELDSARHPSESFSVLDADSSQRKCIEAAKRGCSFVMQGPPGTGKSQTIANIIAEALGDGKRVLFISEKIAALDVVHERLSKPGLDELCLTLHGRNAARKEVVQSLYESLTEQVRPREKVTEMDFARLAELRSRLNDAVKVLHAESPLLLGHSPHQVYAKLAALHNAPAPRQATGAKGPGTESREDLERLSELFRAATRHWDAVTADGYLWRGFEGLVFNDEERMRVKSALSDLDEKTGSLSSKSSEFADRTGLQAPESPLEASGLRVLGELLAEVPDLSAKWLDREQAKVLKSAVLAAEQAHRHLDGAEGSFKNSYPYRQLDDCDGDAKVKLESAIEQLDVAIGGNESWDGQLVERLPSLRQFLTRAGELCTTLEEHGKWLAGRLGQPWHQPTLTTLDHLSELGELAFGSEDRPDPRWLIPTALKKAQEVLQQCQGEFDEYNAKLASLRADYSEQVLELDIEAMITRFEANQDRRFAKLSGQYRADVRALKAMKVDGRAPESALDDLRHIYEIRALQASIDARSSERAQAFGALDLGRATDTAAIGRACDIAQRALSLTAPNADLKVLAECVCVGSQPDLDIGQSISVLQSALSEMREGLAQLDALSAVAQRTPSDAASLAELAPKLASLQQPVGRLDQELAALALGRTAPTQSLADIQADAECVSALSRAQDTVSSSAATWTTSIGDAYRGQETDWQKLHAAGGWLEQLFEHLPGEIPAQLGEMLMQRSAPDVGALAAAHEAWIVSSDRFIGLFDAPREAELREDLNTQPFGRTNDLLHALASSVDDLYEWTDFATARAEIAQRGWGPVLDDFALQQIPAAEVLDAFHRAYWNNRLDALFEAHPELKEFRGRSHEDLIEDFKAVDRSILEGSADRILKETNSRRTTPVSVPGSEVQMLKHEAKKQRRHMPVRKLLMQLRELLPTLKPCMMMSPLSVSHYLSPDHHFDLVIFDEASQVTPWDAVNCIYRGDQLIVAGDSKQLPPTSFFERGMVDDEGSDEDELTEEVMESILGSCEALLPSETLRWHYRSQHEHLIAYSNHHFYSNRLVTFPAPVLESSRLGVHFHHVEDGIYDRGRSRTNRVEARVVAERVISHLRDDSDRSIGVVTFSAAQTEAVLDELEKARMANPDLEEFFTDNRLDGVFVKNLEAVQGDERDVIVFSVGYAYDEHGKFTMAFGPLTSDAGPRRLNVAVTRARQQVEVVSSVRAHDFSLTDSASPGAHLLKKYLEFAEQGPESLRSEIESLGGEYESPFEESVAEEVRALGYQVLPQVGVGGFRIDLGVVNPNAPGQFTLGIECDGATYHSSPTARDRDRLRQEVLEGLGWRIHRIWSWDWVRERHNEVDRLREAIEASLASPQRPVAPIAKTAGAAPTQAREREVVAVHEIQASDDANRLPWVSRYELADLSPFKSRFEFHDPLSAETLVRGLSRLLEVEAPISIGYAIKRLATANGISRRGGRVMATGSTVVQSAIDAGLAERRGEFLWRPGQALGTVRIPDPAKPATRRSIEDIAPEELAVTVARLREASGALDKQGLVGQAARVLGFSRTGPAIQDALEKVVGP